MNALRLGLMGCLLIVLAACNRPLQTTGKYLTQAESAQITRGMTQDQVREILGSPSYVSALDPNFWAYIGTKSEVRPLRLPRPIERRILAIQFTGTRATDLALLDLKDGRRVFPDPNKTPTNGRTINLLEELLGNVGRFE